jgi:sugar lactone lactonase YvrE
MRPAYATVGSQGTDGKASGNEYLSFSAGQVEDDFNSFGDTSAKSGASAQRPKQQQQQKRQRPSNTPRRKSNPLSKLSPKVILIGVAVLVAVVLLICLLVAVFSSPDKAIEKENNVYKIYVTADGGSYGILSNGKKIDHTFDGEIELYPAKDYSFAYVFEEVLTDDGNTVTRMYILDGKKLDLVQAEADKIIKWADYEPGIIFKEGGVVQFYSENAFEDISSDPSADNFIISGDASTVVYTELSGRDRETTTVKYFRNAGFNDIGSTEGLIPTAISNDGTYVYAYDETNALYYIEVSKRGASFEQKPIVESTAYTFNSVNSLNVDGTEVVFSYVHTNGKLVSWIYQVGNKKPVAIGEGKFEYLPDNNKTVCPSSLIDAYFIAESTVTDEDGDSEKIISTYLYDGKKARKLADEIGQFSPDGKYFYYIDSESADFVRVPLSSKNFEEDAVVVTRAIESFVLTEKGDIYTYSKPSSSAGGKIVFRKASDSTSKSVSHRSDTGSMFLCGSTIYFAETLNDELKIYSSTDGATKEEVTFKKVICATPLTIEMGAGDKGYAYFVDANGDTKLLYTSNGKTFDIVLDACLIPGYDSGITPPATEGEDEKITEGATDGQTE